MTKEELYLKCHELFYIDALNDLRRKYHVSPNARKDSIAGNIDGQYRRVKITGKSYLVHRLIYLMLTNDLPEVVDHINGNTLDNSRSNLRSSTKLKNRWNCLGNSGTKTGVKGVYLDHGRYKALITVDGARYYLGMFSSLEAASRIVDRSYTELQAGHSLQESRLSTVISP
jgi:hypothetical protein